jgi:SAM-dependent methyltransferase
MNSTSKPLANWGASYRLVASEKWKAQSAVMGRQVTEAIVEYAQPRPGMKALDLASGTGEPAISLASRVLPGGHVTAFDLSPDLLEIADDRARQRQLTNFATKQGDAHQLPFPDSTFDLVSSRFGVMFFQDCVSAMREVRRVLKPGGRACFVVWGPLGQPYWSSTMMVAHSFAGGPILAPDGPNPFRFGEAGSLSGILREAGFDAVNEESRTVPWTWPGTPQDVWDQARAVSTPFLPMLDRIPAEKWDEVDRAVRAAIAAYVVGDRIEFGATVNLVSGEKP